MNRTLVRAAILFFVSASAASEAPLYVGWRRCQPCHFKQATLWKTTAHASALDRLKPEERSRPDCLACHSTGSGAPAEEDSELTHVQCEACHGPGSSYKSLEIMNKNAYGSDPASARKRAMAAGLILPDEKTCLRCHNPGSPTFKGFDFRAAMERIRHWD